LSMTNTRDYFAAKRERRKFFLTVTPGRVLDGSDETGLLQSMI